MPLSFYLFLFFQNLDKNLFASLCLCNCFLCVTTDGDLEAVTHKYPFTTHFTFPCRLIFPPPFFFSLFPNSRANEHVRRLRSPGEDCNNIYALRWAVTPLVITKIRVHVCMLEFIIFLSAPMRSMGPCPWCRGRLIFG